MGFQIQKATVIDFSVERQIEIVISDRARGIHAHLLRETWGSKKTPGVDHTSDFYCSRSIGMIGFLYCFRTLYMDTTLSVSSCVCLWLLG